MQGSLLGRVDAFVTTGVTALILAAELGFLTAVYHSDDAVDARAEAHARLTGALDTWAETSDNTALQAAADELDGVSPGLEAAVVALRDGAAPDEVARLRVLESALGAEVRQAQDAADVRALGIHVGLLVLVSVGWFIWFRNLVARHRTLQQRLTEREVLDQGERRLLALVENSADLVAVVEADATVSFVSPAVTAILGMTPAELVGRPLTEVLEPDDQPRFIQALAAGDKQHALLVRARHQDGRALFLEGTVNNLLADVAVSGLVVTLRDVTARKALEEQLTHQAFHDSLTALANRELFRERLGYALRRRPGRTEPLTVLVLDLDNFKNVNDGQGHHVGDQVLGEVARRIAQTVREGDTAARLGGDEFAVLLEDACVDEANEVAARITEVLGLPVAINGHEHRVEASIGIATAMPGTASSDELLRNADVAMYWAKSRGKGTVAVYDEALHQVALDRLELVRELQEAIRGDQLTLHYQPLVSLDQGRVTGFEALVRWQHPRRGLLQPLQFLPEAEQSGLIVPLGSWVLREACHAGAALNAERSVADATSMSVNVAAQHLVRPDFLDEVVSALAVSGMRPDRLVLEITEGALLSDLEAAVAVLTQLKALGIRIAVDDFGTGYSSLSYLNRLPVDILKIDKSFVDGLGTSDQATTVVETIISMSRTLRLACVAEGVESHEQATWLREANCTSGQGYLWSRPVEFSVAHQLLRAAFDVRRDQVVTSGRVV